MSAPLALPRPVEVFRAARDTRLLLKLRWRLVRGRVPRTLIWLGIGGLLAVLFLFSNIGFFIRRIAEDGAGTDAAQFAVTYVQAVESGDLGAIGAAALGSVVAAALFSPFTGAANQSLTAADDLATLRPHRLHRYFDGLVTGAVSSIGMLQLFVLTALASLLTLDGGRAGALLVTWAVWPTLSLIAAAEAWAIELVHRSRGPKTRRTIGLSLLAVIGAAAAVDPQHGKTLFGLGTAYSATLREAAAGNTGHTLAAFSLLAGVGVAAFLIGLMLCRAALSHPAVPAAGAKERKRRVPLSKRPRIALLQVLASTMLRTNEVRRPLLTVLALGLPAAWFSGSAGTTATALVIAIPLSVALVWGVNMFGVLGPGMTWLAAQPRTLRWLLPAAITMQVATMLLIAALCWLPPTLLGFVSLPDASAITAGTVVSIALISRSAAAKSVHKPTLTRLGARGDVLIPPLRAMNYTFRFAVWGGQIGVLVLSTGDRWIQVGLVTVALCWTGLRLVWLLRQWRNRERQARLIATVAA